MWEGQAPSHIGTSGSLVFIRQLLGPFPGT